ncbi:MAG: LacI family DNA-binding transcriptional regulator [Acidimicrobiales bacterium]|nr:LacI family DNA-binding transcriptional regulator [Acidimicrobiales bacterium]
MPTIADVAAHAGVGQGTVSRVLNGSPKVRDATRARVLSAIELLDYRPNPLARGLSRGRCQTLGVVVPFFTHASAIERLRGVASGLDGSRYDLVLFNVESPVHRDEHIASITGRDRADGLLVLSLPVADRDLQRLTAAGVPVVLVDAPGTGVPTVVTDDRAGGRVATQHLVDLGHRAIGYLGHDPSNPFGFTATDDREAGYLEVLADAGLPVRRELIRYGPHDREAGRALAAELLAEPHPPTAIFASSDAQAMGVLAATEDAGLRVPRDLSVIGFDDVELSSYVGLTTVRQPLFESGRLGVELLLAALAGDPPPPTVHALPLELVVRSTTAPAPRRHDPNHISQPRGNAR